jgi:hypothetical protein
MVGGVAAGAQAMRKPGAKSKRSAARSATVEPPAPAPVSEPEAEADEPAILQRLEATPKWSGAIVAGGLMLVAGLSFFAIRGMTRRKP